MSVLRYALGGWREDRTVRVVGVDAWRGGWVAVVLEDGQVSDVRLAVTLDQITDECPDAVVGVDMPLGLVERGWRKADRLGVARLAAGRRWRRARRPGTGRSPGARCWPGRASSLPHPPQAGVGGAAIAIWF
jgi:hypothetical protein